MKGANDLASRAANLVYTPTLLAYGWIIVHYVVAGIGLYFIALVVAYKTGVFDNYARWPMVSKVALYTGVPYMVLGVYFSTQPTTYSMLIPAGLNVLLSIVGGLALRGLNPQGSD